MTATLEADISALKLAMAAAWVKAEILRRQETAALGGLRAVTGVGFKVGLGAALACGAPAVGLGVTTANTAVRGGYL